MRRKIFLLILCLVVCGGAIYLWFSKEKPAIDLVKYIEARVSKEDVTPGFTPVLVFRVKSLQGKTAEVFSSASGTAFIGRSGKWKIATAAHIFSKEYQGCMYLFRRLRPYEQSATMGASSVRQICNDDFDVADCTVDNKAQKINGFSAIGGEFSENRILRGSYRPLEEAGIVGFKSFSLTSVVSGEHVKMYAISVTNYGNMFHWIIGYAGVLGESGTGFVDEHQWLYVLSGNIPVAAVPKEWRDKFKIPPDEKGLSIISGPIDVLSRR